MKEISELSNKLKNLEHKFIDELVKAQQDTAKTIEADARTFAPGSGEYSQSITAKETVVANKTISTAITTNMMTKVAISTGKQYNLGMLLETGTDPHAIPNAFNWGVIYGYDSEMYKRTLSPDWHPGFVSMPHFHPALDKNKELYEKNINEAFRRAMK